MSYRQIFHTVFGAVGTAGVYLFGGFDMVLQVLIAFLVLDIITGVLKSSVTGRVSSEVYLAGAVKKVGILILVSMGHLMDQVVEMDSPLIRTVVIMTLIGYEGLSILENLTDMGVPVPVKLVVILDSLKEEEEIQ